MNYETLGTGADESIKDPRTVEHLPDMAYPLIKGGSEYSVLDIEHQHAVGICTAISRVQLRQKQMGKRYSPDFQYLLQKKYFDFNWNEGSSILSANKVAKLYGFLPYDLWTHTTENDRFLPYNEYIAKLEAVPLDEILRLLKLCIDPIAGYAAVNVSDPQAIAKAVIDSPKQAGILCRYGCQKNWWTSIKGVASWLAKDIDPLRYAPETSGHAIILASFDYTSDIIQKLANTWGTLWCLDGSAHINWSNYKMNEAWIDLFETPVINPHPTTRKGDKGPVVKELQGILNDKTSYILKIDGDFGNKTLQAVIEFQKEHGLKVDGVVGPLTWSKLLE